MGTDVPTGSDGATVGKYFDYLYNHYLNQLVQTWHVTPMTFVWWGVWLAVLAGGVWFAVRYQRGTRSRHEPYPVESYNGYITEGNGPVGLFLMLFFVGMFVWAVLLTILHLLRGQIY